MSFQIVSCCSERHQTSTSGGVSSNKWRLSVSALSAVVPGVSVRTSLWVFRSGLAIEVRSGPSEESLDTSF